GLHTFSKILFPGMRLGWMIGDEAVIQKMVIAKQSVDLCTPAFTQAIVAEFAARGLLNKVIDNVKIIYREKRELMLSSLEEYMPDLPGLSWTRPQGGLFLWLRLPKNIDTERLFYEAVENDVAFVVGTAFYCDSGGKNAMRLNFSYPTKEDIVEGVKRLARVIINHKPALKAGADVMISP
ncbi:MAG: PLP-dependent aminotransferase family protein, partial [Thermoleophilia bacterium]|nr:PLP-dependent aminotransferase family protein [Thermoleophilia bacterium]